MRGRRSRVAAAFCALAACRQARGRGEPEGDAAVESAVGVDVEAENAVLDANGIAVGVEARGESGANPSFDCPPDMVAVRSDYCPDVERRCVVAEHDDNNHLEICHEFAHEQTCRVRTQSMAFCIDWYEYPNRKGEHPAWMVSWYQAQATCETRGKRLCWAREWTAACEGPENSPFPYGWQRDPSKCNMDNLYIKPELPDGGGEFLFYSSDRVVAFQELSRLDRSVPSGSMESCHSGFGIYDLTGNVDEWVVSDEPPRGRSKWAGLKGGGGSRSKPMPSDDVQPRPGICRTTLSVSDVAETSQGAPNRSWAPSPQAMRPPSVLRRTSFRSRSSS